MQPKEMQSVETREPNEYLYIPESNIKISQDTFTKKPSTKSLPINSPVDFDGSFGGEDGADGCF